MGMSGSGSMVVGLHSYNIAWDQVEEYLVNNKLISEGDCGGSSDLAEEVGFKSMSPYYDAGFEESIVGFEIEDIYCGEEALEVWFKTLKELVQKFKEITGDVPVLYGTQNVY